MTRLVASVKVVSILTASGRELDQSYNFNWKRDVVLEWTGYTTDLVLVIECNQDSSQLAIGEGNYVGVLSPEIHVRCRPVKQSISVESC